MKFISLLPTEANNNYQGLKFALWFFYLYLALVAFRSFTHMFAQDAGLNSIASIIILPLVPYQKNLLSNYRKNLKLFMMMKFGKILI